jgi:hypothetical protein
MRQANIPDDILIEETSMRKRGERATHLHTKSGGCYIELHRGVWERDCSDVVIYQAVHDGRIWVRSAKEFDDGRFAPLTRA